MNDFSSLASDITKGLTSEFIEREMELLNAIIDGKAIEHHLEPSYYKALKNVIESYMRAMEREREEDEEMRGNE